MAEVYVSTNAFKTRDVAEILELCVANGIPNLELSSGTRHKEGILAHVRRYHGRPMRYQVHNYFPPHKDPFVLNLASLAEDILERTLNHCKAAIDLSLELGLRHYSVHAGAAMNARPSDLGKPQTHLVHSDPERAYETFVGSVRSLADYAASRGLRLLIENHVVARFNLIDGENKFLFASTPGDILRLLLDVGAPNLGVLLDVGHLNVTANSLGLDRYKFIDDIAPYIGAFQLNDNDGRTDQGLPFDRTAWFLPCLRGFPDATFTIESDRLDLDQIRSCQEVIAEVLG